MAIFTEPNITAPTEPFSYQGKQVIVNGDRLLFNAKNDDILLYSNTYLGFSTNGSILLRRSRDPGSIPGA